MLTEQQLRSYLAWAIHGRKPPRRASSSTRKGPPRDQAYLEWIREMPCLACGIEGRSEAAHTGQDGCMSMKASDYSCVPLMRGLPHASARRVPSRGQAGLRAGAWALLRGNRGAAEPRVASAMRVRLPKIIPSHSAGQELSKTTGRRRRPIPPGCMASCSGERRSPRYSADAPRRTSEALACDTSRTRYGGASRTVEWPTSPRTSGSARAAR
jgi:hypothetical protein